MEKAFQWLKECSVYHKRCNLLERSVLPDRILDIYSSSDTLFLREPNNIRDRYTCLSYCWGSAEFISTTKGNISSHKIGIPLQSLPQTFRDAIWVSRSLNVRYIWIDALCIIQDDIEDWNTQSQKMAAIFSNSYLTISAIASKDPHSGCFAEASSISLGVVSGRCYTHLPPGSDFAPPDMPLLRRGWVLQEALLSPRILHFGPAELIWECAEVQCGQATHFLDEIRKSSFYDSLIAKNPILLTELPKLWRRILIQYSPLLLTKSSDKLFAIASIAKLMRDCRGSDYLAGLWRDSFALDMLWTARVPSPSSPKLMKRAPSWSWASVDGPIKYNQSLYLQQPVEPIIHCKLLHAEINMEGKKVAGIAKVECSKMKIWSFRKGEERKSLQDRLWELGFYFHPDRDQFPDGDFYVLRIARVLTDEAVVVRSLDSACSEYKRVGRATRAGGFPDLIWPRVEVITIS
jgi:hypothetical protein